VPDEKAGTDVMLTHSPSKVLTEHISSKLYC